MRPASAPPAPAVRLAGVQAAAAPAGGRAVLRGIDLAIAPGEQVAVIGASGSGKTTLLHLLACALPPLAGTLWLHGVAPWSLAATPRQRLRARAFLAPQVPPLPPRQRVVNAVLAGRLPSMSLGASLASLWHPARADLAFEALAALDLGDKLWSRVDRLSGGERQRVGLARVLVSQATLWLIDEPLSALDPVRSEQAIAAITAAAAAGSRTLVCTLHQVEVARRRFPRVVALRDGAVVYDGPAAGLDDRFVREIYAGERAAAPAADAAPGPAAAMPPEAMCR